MRLKRLLAILLVMCFVFSVMPLYATPDDINKLTEEQKKNTKQQQTTQSTIAKKSKEIKQTSAQLESLDKKKHDTEASLEKVEKELINLENKIAVTKRELERASENAVGQNELLKKRVRVMYENGNMGYLAVILDSTSFSDFLTRLDFLRKIVEYDVKLLSEMNDYKNNIEQTKFDLETEQNEKEMLKEQIGKKKLEIEQLIKDKEKTLDDLSDDLEELEKQLDELQKRSEELVKLITAAQSSAKYKGGDMDWPSPGYYTVTSEYGLRMHPILKKNKMHTGIDIRVPSGSDIVAANSGKVIYSGYNGGYGYTVIIDHGGKISTLYAHNSKLLVSEGDEVKKGDKIAKSGSTGLSTGPHLHFEVRKDGQHIDPMEYYKK